MGEPKPFEAIKLQPGQSLAIDPRQFGGELKPIRLWVLPHGTVKNKPSFAFELVDIFGNTFIAQISDEMLRDGIIAAGEMEILSHQ